MHKNEMPGQQPAGSAQPARTRHHVRPVLHEQHVCPFRHQNLNRRKEVSGAIIASHLCSSARFGADGLMSMPDPDWWRTH